MRRLTTAVVAGLFLLTAHNVHAYDDQKGNALWGKYAIQTCRTCHKEKGLSGLEPEEKSTAEWEAFFADKYKKLRDMNHDFASMGINERQLENIHRYLVEESGKKEGGDTAVQSAASAKNIEAEGKKVAKAPDKTPAPEGGEKFNAAAGDAAKGRYVFRRCLTCHKKESATIISPADRTMAAWERYFADDFKKFKKEMPKFDTYGFTPAQMADLHKFVMQYALDAAKPKTCE